MPPDNQLVRYSHRRARCYSSTPAQHRFGLSSSKYSVLFGNHQAHASALERRAAKIVTRHSASAEVRGMPTDMIRLFQKLAEFLEGVV